MLLRAQRRICAVITPPDIEAQIMRTAGADSRWTVPRTGTAWEADHRNAIWQALSMTFIMPILSLVALVKVYRIELF